MQIQIPIMVTEKDLPGFCPIAYQTPEKSDFPSDPSIYFQDYDETFFENLEILFDPKWMKGMIFIFKFGKNYIGYSVLKCIINALGFEYSEPISIASLDLVDVSVDDTDYFGILTTYPSKRYRRGTGCGCLPSDECMSSLEKENKELKADLEFIKSKVEHIEGYTQML